MKFALTLFLASFCSASALAQSTTTFTYQGELKEAGVPANGLYDMRFRMYDAPLAGTQISTTLCYDNVSVVDGKFTVLVNFASRFPVTSSRFLEIDTRADTGLTCASGAGYSTLSPRQPLTAAPRADAAFSANRLFTGDGAIEAARVADDGSVGIGTNSFTPFAKLTVRGQGSTMWLQGTGAGDANSTSLFFVDSTGVDTGYLGDASGANSDIDLSASNGGLNFHTLFGQAMKILPNGNIGIGTTSPGKKLTVDGDMEIGTGAGDYQHLRLGGGNSSGFVYGSFAGLGDGIHMGYNYYRNAAGTTVVPNVGGGTSRISTGYGYIGLATGAINTDPTDRITIFSDGRVGIGYFTPQSSNRLDVNGGIRCTSVTQTSSAVFKDDIQPLSQGLHDLMQLNPVSYTWNEKAPPEDCGRHDLGFIAEDVATVLPDAVARNTEGKAIGIDYSRITVLAVQAIKQQQIQHESDRAEIKSLQERLAKLETLLAK